jgi:hypothetical protein
MFPTFNVDMSASPVTHATIVKVHRSLLDGAQAAASRARPWQRLPSISCAASHVNDAIVVEDREGSTVPIGIVTERDLVG